MLHRQVTTDTTLPNATRNQIVKEADIQCHAIGCETKANRWSNLCGHCEAQYLNWNMPIFGLPSSEQMAEAKALIRSYYQKQIDNKILDTWAKHISNNMYRPESLAISPMKIKDKPNPKDRVEHILAWRAKGRVSKGRIAQGKGISRHYIINLLAFCLCVDTFITPTIPQPLRRDYLLFLLGMRFMGRKVIPQTKLRLKTKLIKTGFITYTETGPVEELRRVEVEEPEVTAYRIKRADFRLIGRMLWNTMAKTLLGTGGRQGRDWQGLKDELNLRVAA